MGLHRNRLRIFMLAFAFLGMAVVALPVVNAATLLVVNYDAAGEGFNDPTPVSPVGGNTGTTVGAQRLIAFQHAASIWGGLLSSSVPIRVGAQFNPLSCTSTSAVLGSAGPTNAFRDFTGAPVAATFYPIALANALHGSDLGVGLDDIDATFSSTIGTPGCLDSSGWYYGLDAHPPSGKIDFVSVLVHELGHGLGFLTFVDLASGAKVMGFNDTFMRNLERHGAAPSDYPSMSDAQRVAASKDTGNLHWVGANVKAASGILSAGKVIDHVQMYAPSLQEPGSSVSHWNTALTLNQVMEPNYTGPLHNPVLELPLFKDIGWTLLSAPCTYTLGSAGLSAGSAAVIGNVSVTAAPGCAWTAVRNAAWITITSGASGSGNGSVGYSVAANTTASSRTGTLTIAGKTFTVTQNGAGTLPAAPTIGVASAGNGTARVAFTPGAIGSGTLLNYTAVCGNVTATGTSPIMVLGLANGIAYNCKVRTTSTVGIGPWSALSNSVTPSAALALPAAPAIGVATAGNGTARVAFTPGAIGSGTLLNYTAMCGSVTATGTSPIMVLGLTNGTAYNCKVRTTSTVGIGPWSALSNTVTPSAALLLPAAPIIGVATAGNGTARVAFTPGAIGSGTLLSYTAMCGTVTATGTSPIMVLGLTNGIAYTCKVRTTSTVGIGPWSALSNTVTPSATPLSVCTAISPAAPSVVRGSASPLLTATCSNSPTSYVWKVGATTLACTGATCTVPAANLPTVGTYTVTVKANNAGGAGTQAASATITVSTQPLSACTAISPATPSVMRGSASPLLAATCNNSPTSYVWKVGATTLACPGATCAVPAASLPAAGTYTVTVRANNAAGAGTQAASATVTVTPGAAPITARIAAGDSGTCALTSAGGVKCWGSGQLTPVNVTGLASGVSAIAAGSAHTCALTSAGGVKCWGNNNYGQLGDNSITQRLTPVDVSGLTSGVVAIAAGDSHTCALTSAGGVKCWGWNSFGQVGDNTNTVSLLIPVAVTGLSSGVRAISAGYGHTCALTSGGGMKCWGYNGQGQLGDDSTLRRPTPVDVSGLTSGVSAIAAGRLHTCALTSAGGVKCWGWNAYGQLGDNSMVNQLIPVNVSGLTSGVSALALGGQHTCALTSGGGVKCWGNNTTGQLGDNSNTKRLTPVGTSGLTSGVSALAAGARHTCALTSAGVAKCWGDNFLGQLGDNTTTTRFAPVNVSGF